MDDKSDFADDYTIFEFVDRSINSTFNYNKTAKAMVLTKTV